MNFKKSPNISVIMSVYNGERYIARALISVLCQTYSDFELILVDDGSTDRTAEIVAHVKDDRLKFFQQNNMGLTKTLNKALALAKGSWIARHDADDFSIVSRFARQLNFLEKNSAVGMLGSNCFIQPEKHCIINEVYDYPERHQEIVDAFTTYNPFVHGSMMIRRDLLESVGGYNEAYRYVQDYELWSRLLLKTQAHNLNTPLYVRSVHQQASQMSVDKLPVFNEIKSRYLDSLKSAEHTLDVNVNVRPITSISLYPLLTIKDGWNKSIAKTFYQMSRESRKHQLKWSAWLGQAFLYSPWSLIGSDHA